MRRRSFLALGAGMGAASMAEALAGVAQVADGAGAGLERKPLLMRAGMSRSADGSVKP